MVTEEEITLNTGGLTTDSSANLLPANSVIEAVTARITVAITGLTSTYALGDAATPARFAAANAILTANSTEVGLDHWDTAKQKQTSAAKVRITTVGIPSAGKVRVTVFSKSFQGATS